MSLPVWLQELFTLGLHLSHAQQLGLAFVLGSFAVATWSDLKYMAAQREFLEVWVVLVLGAILFDSWRCRQGDAPWQVMAIKWSLIAGLSIASWRQVGWLLRLARGDVAALAAAACLLPPLLVILLFVVAKVTSYGLAPLLSRGRPHYPFMPIVSVATLAVLAVGLAVKEGSS